MSSKVTKPLAGITGRFGMRYFFGDSRSSLRYHPEISAREPDRFKSSIVSTAGRSVCVSASLITTGGKTVGVGAGEPGVPLITPPARQLAGSFHALGGSESPAMTSEKPRPSVILYQS